jgi:hypothetical protein
LIVLINHDTLERDSWLIPNSVITFEQRQSLLTNTAALKSAQCSRMQRLFALLRQDDYVRPLDDEAPWGLVASGGGSPHQLEKPANSVYVLHYTELPVES